MKISDIWSFFRAKAEDQIRAKDLLRELLQSKPVYTNQKINTSMAEEMQDDIETYIDRMPQCIKAKYNDNAHDTVQKLYTLALGVKTAMKKERRTPASGRSETPQRQDCSSEEAVTPQSS